MKRLRTVGVLWIIAVMATVLGALSPAQGDITLVPSHGTTTFNGQILAASGTAAAPSISFNLDPDTAFYSFAANVIGWASGGVVKGVLASNIGLTSTGQYLWGASTDPNSPDTGIGRSSAGIMRLTNSSTTTRGLFGGGGAVASATALAVPVAGVYHVTGTTTITSITSTNLGSGVCITLIFDGILTFTDGSNLVLAGDFVTTANDTISLCYDGTNWYETDRSAN